MKHVVILSLAVANSVLQPGCALNTKKYADERDGFSLSYPSTWRLWEDSEAEEHLTLRSPNDHIMVFVNSKVLDQESLPESEDQLESWGRALYVRPDPDIDVRADTVSISKALFMPCVSVRLTTKTRDGKELRSEIFSFTEYYLDKKRTRMWKLFAIMEESKMTDDEKAGWQIIQKTFRATRFIE